jgi:hypothetical protein
MKSRVGGNGFFTLRQIVELIMELTHALLFTLTDDPAGLSSSSMVSCRPFLSSFWLDYFAVNRPARWIPCAFSA